MIIAIFRSKVALKHLAEFEERYSQMSELIMQIPGYVYHERYTPAPGEGVVIVEFANQTAFEAWDKHPEHKKAKMLGKEYIFESYDVKVGKVFESHKMP